MDASNRIAVASSKFSKGRLRIRIQGLLFEYISNAFALSVILLIGWIGLRLFRDSALTRSRYGLGFLTHSVWDVPHEVYGASTFIFGTLLSSTLALIIAVPISVGAALFLTEVAPRWLAGPVSFVIELLAAIPSIVYGLWGFIVLCPLLQAHVSPWLAAHLGANPLFAGPPVLTNMLAAGIILAIMIMPIITSVSREVIQTVPRGTREASLGLGATQWETLRNIVLPEARSGITGAVVLGLGRAIGETMAVVMVIGNTPQVKASLLQSGYTLPALLANQFNEAYNDNLQRSALLEIALVLFIVTVLVTGMARALLILTTKRITASSHGIPSLLEKARAGLDLAGRYAFRAAIFGFIGLQVVSDVKAKGPRALLGGFELLLCSGIVLAFLLHYLGGKTTERRLRNGLNTAVRWIASLSAFLVCCVLGAVLIYVAAQGIKGLSLNLFTELPRPPGVPGGGFKNAVFGTLELIAIAGAIGIPLGLMAGVFVAEFGNSWIGGLVRFAADVLNGIPSVVIGLFAYAAFVLPFGHFSAWAGGAALAVMMVPTIARTTEEMLRLVPIAYREAASGLGATKVQTILTLIIPAAKSGILAGVMLAIARVAGETAPLLFTAFGNDQLNVNPSQPVSSLTMKIYQYAITPYDDWVRQAWAGAFVLLLIILIFNLFARYAIGKTKLAR